MDELLRIMCAYLVLAAVCLSYLRWASYDTMARKLIRLSGYEPGVDIKVVCTGLRPGEKQYGALAMKKESPRGTAIHLIHIGTPFEMNDERFKKQLEPAHRFEDSYVEELAAQIVPTYRLMVEV